VVTQGATPRYLKNPDIYICIQNAVYKIRITVMKKFFLSMFSNGEDVSSKRFSAFFSLFNIVILAYVATFMSEDKVTPEFMFDALALIAGGGLGLTVVEKIFSKKGGESKEVEKTQNPPEAQANTSVEMCKCGSDPASCPNCKPLG
jgi:uncharacterized membrane protein YbhN (UPF0104 family)